MNFARKHVNNDQKNEVVDSEYKRFLGVLDLNNVDTRVDCQCDRRYTRKCLCDRRYTRRCLCDRRKCPCDLAAASLNIVNLTITFFNVVGLAVANFNAATLRRGPLKQCCPLLLPSIKRRSEILEDFAELMMLTMLMILMMLTMLTMLTMLAFAIYDRLPMITAASEPIGSYCCHGTTISSPSMLKRR